MITHEDLICVGCGKHPNDLAEYREAAAGEPEDYKSAADYVMREEGTLNRQNGHFLCTPCYEKAGQPSSPRGWVAP